MIDIIWYKKGHGEPGMLLWGRAFYFGTFGFVASQRCSNRLSGS